MALCLGLEITEIFSYYEESPSEQFIEMQNTSGAEINMLGCGLRYKNKIYYLPEYALMPSDYYAHYRAEMEKAFGAGSCFEVRLV